MEINYPVLVGTMITTLSYVLLKKIPSKFKYPICTVLFVLGFYFSIQLTEISKYENYTLYGIGIAALLAMFTKDT